MIRSTLDSTLDAKAKAMGDGEGEGGDNAGEGAVAWEPAAAGAKDSAGLFAREQAEG